MKESDSIDSLVGIMWLTCIISMLFGGAWFSEDDGGVIWAVLAIQEELMILFVGACPSVAVLVLWSRAFKGDNRSFCYIVVLLDVVNIE